MVGDLTGRWVPCHPASFSSFLQARAPLAISWRDWLARVLLGSPRERRGEPMLWAIALVLGLIWAVRMASSHTGGGYVHLLIAVAIIVAGYGLYRRNREWRVP